jgi:hypothetical protein
MIKLGLCSYSKSSPFYFQLRATYYIFLKGVEEDEEAQKRGAVGCVYCVGGGIGFDLQLIRRGAKLRMSLPVRFDSTHLCYNDPRLVPIFSLIMSIMGPHNRMRLRVHYGSHEECQYKLSNFRIPVAALPVSPRGEFNLENHRTFMATQRSIEATTKSKSKGPPCVAQNATKKPEEKAQSRQPIKKEDVFVAPVPQPVLNEPTGYGGFMRFKSLGSLPQPSFAIPWCGVAGAPNLPLAVVSPQRRLPSVPQSHIIGSTITNRPPAKFCKSPAKPYVIDDPLPNDVLLGRGKPIQERPGNVRLREMIDTHKDKYEQKGAKRIVSAYIVRLVKEEGGRFLKEVEHGGWVEVDDDTARTKVSHAFRARRGCKAPAKL